ncbi:MAG: Sulfurtransferase [Candidatus Nomurabacteria bacterium GW2011_GWE1_32_28]|uniref:Sulfurtransferase n=1 Tax=Candidatus Nomurabacteria bacterium GW2011_GWF1_31_48 TaxID=1618767 RepID=A0A0G0BHI1_9BACT|nr:MAG: Sulfurtransferase [Candidatus Nomurabacteria bacterium GW2011_GWF2_30_133]KKP29083.1 MAG: Sulfurtransferase [Candidatus Nomurabacteria bacterium GW2011_GWE2_31_40]KKP30507.1 MAG: Sulfurtransferase [Candidatus Nomurabacteria bacterium GW2011_GWF1_31_48]KKP34992.1 MAG: Sulfurtransferase [Candidatus Nomurabacteria bacterium GW2011_GWE1_32_28]
MKYKNIYNIIGSIIIAIGLITFAVYSTKCIGSECKVENIPVKAEQVTSKMNPEVINKQVENNEIVLLDVREDSEWNEGHIKGAQHIALGNLNTETIKDLPKNIPIYIYCRSGRRAGEAEIKLKELNFNNVEKLGGIIEWQEKGGALITK